MYKLSFMTVAIQRQLYSKLSKVYFCLVFYFYFYFLFAQILSEILIGYVVICIQSFECAGKFLNCEMNEVNWPRVCD
jgi:hypothetical protein